MQKQTRYKQTLLRHTVNEDAEKAMIQFKHKQTSPLPGLKSRVNLNHIIRISLELLYAQSAFLVK